MCHAVPGSLGSGNTAFIGTDLLYLGSLPLFRNVSLVPCSLNLHILRFFYVDGRSVCSQLRPLSVEMSGSSSVAPSSKCVLPSSFNTGTFSYPHRRIQRDKKNLYVVIYFSKVNPIKSSCPSGHSEKRGEGFKYTQVHAAVQARGHTQLNLISNLTHPNLNLNWNSKF